MTAPLRSFDTYLGRFYAHPQTPPEDLRTTRWGGGTWDVPKLPRTRFSPNPSITNIMKVLDEGFLPGYHSKLVATYAVEHLDEVTTLISESSPEAAIELLRAVPDIPHPNAAVGDQIHYAIEQDVARRQGRPYREASLSTIGARRMFAQWLKFIQDEKPEILHSEFNVWSYKHDYAGTGDLMMVIRGMPWIIDLKSGNRIYPKVAMQTAAAQNADSLITADGAEIEMPRSAYLGVLHIRPMSIKLYQIEREEEAWRAFLNCRGLFEWLWHYKDESLPDTPLIEVKASIKGIKLCAMTTAAAPSSLSPANGAPRRRLSRQCSTRRKPRSSSPSSSSRTTVTPLTTSSR